jgi:hypothetical protein
VLLVVGCALAFADASLHTGNREEVLVTALPLSAGQVLSAGDLRLARISTGSGLEVVPASEETTVVGRPVAVPLAAGALLMPGEVGSPSPAMAGSDVVALGLKAGQFPPGLSAGDRVQVVPVTTTPSSSSGSSDGGPGKARPVSATVLSIDTGSADSGSPTVFSLQFGKANADEVASLAAAGQATLIQVGSAR